MDKTKPFGLTIPKRAQSSAPVKSSIFDSDSDDETSKKKFNQTKIPQKKLPVKTDDTIDPSIYAYDEIYDDMKAEQVAKTAPKDKNKPSRYIDTLLKAADKRKKEYERRIEKKVQVERVKEGDKFKDKEEFVTAAYKKKMQELEEEEEKERRRNELDEMMDVTKQKDLSGFYRHFLNQTVGQEKIPDHKTEIKQEPVEDVASGSVKVSDTLPIDEKHDTVEDEAVNDQDKDSDVASYSSDEEVDEDKSTKENLLKPKRNMRQQQSSSEESGSEDENVETESTKRSLKRKVSVNDDESDSGSESGSAETVELNSKSKTEVETVVKKPKMDIFAKRTVGDIFTEAQARFFQRMALRNAGL